MASEFINFRPWEHMNLSSENIELRIEEEFKAYERISKRKASTKKQYEWHGYLMCMINRRIELYVLLTKITKRRT